MSQPEDEANRTAERVTQKESQSLNSSMDPPDQSRPESEHVRAIQPRETMILPCPAPCNFLFSSS